MHTIHVRVTVNVHVHDGVLVYIFISRPDLYDRPDGEQFKKKRFKKKQLGIGYVNFLDHARQFLSTGDVSDPKGLRKPQLNLSVSNFLVFLWLAPDDFSHHQEMSHSGKS